jgi:hypothetical protein
VGFFPTTIIKEVIFLEYSYIYDDNSQKYIVTIGNKNIYIDNNIICDLSDKLNLNTEEEAIDCYLCDNNYITNDIQSELDKKAKKVKINKGITRKKPEKTEKIRKIDNIKLFLFDIVENNLKDIATITYKLNEVEMDFIYNNESYTFKLTRHGKKWKRKEKS